MRRGHVIWTILVLAVAYTVVKAADKVIVAIDETAHARGRFAGEKLSVSLRGAGFDVSVIQSNTIPKTFFMRIMRWIFIFSTYVRYWN